MTDTLYYRSASPYNPAAFAIRLVHIVIGIIQALLAIRLVLELLGASAASVFVSWIYGVSGAFLGPFAGAFHNIALGSSSTLDIVALLAMIAYAVIGWLIALVLSAFFSATASV